MAELQQITLEDETFLRHVTVNVNEFISGQPKGEGDFSAILQVMEEGRYELCKLVIAEGERVADLTQLVNFT